MGPSSNCKEPYVHARYGPTLPSIDGNPDEHLVSAASMLVGTSPSFRDFMPQACDSHVYMAVSLRTTYSPQLAKLMPNTEETT